MNEQKEFIIDKKLFEHIKSLSDGSLENEHLYKVSAFAYELEGKVSTDFFEKAKVDSIEIMCQYEFYDGYVLYFDIINKEGQIMNKLDFMLQKLEQVSYVEGLVAELKGFEKKFTSFRENICYPLNLKPGISQEILEVFFSKELKTLFDYNMIKSELPKNQEKSKKLKI